VQIDRIHDIQKAYRKVVDSLAKPGKINSLLTESQKIDIDLGCYNSTVVLMLMLLDTETTFRIISFDKEITKKINQLTYSKHSSDSEADFIFITNEADTGESLQVVYNAKTGTLTDPHKSATIIIETDDFTRGKTYKLKGPGIQECREIRMDVNEKILEARNDKNSEYPTGLDLILVDKGSNIICLPRTTLILSEKEL